MEFVHLHLHTEYSLLNSTCKLNDLFESLFLLNMKAVAITDNNLFGAAEFYKMAKYYGIKPIIGMAMKIKYDSSFNEVILLVKNRGGYRNLLKLLAKSYENSDVNPFVLEEQLFDDSDDLVCINIAAGSYISKLLMHSSELGARMIHRYREHFSDFYYEINDFNDLETRKLNVLLLKLKSSNDYGLGDLHLVATNAVHFIKKEDYENYRKIVCIGKGCTLSQLEESDQEIASADCYLKSREEMIELFSYLPDAISNTVKISQKCEFEFDFHSKHLPKFFSEAYGLPRENTDEEKSYSLLRELCFKGIAFRHLDSDEIRKKRVIERLEMELSIIRDMGYVDYFLIVWDFVMFAKSHQIRVGPGRGSGGASIVAYLLRITDIDPIEYGLIFERFLNPQRVSMPDFDIDFQDNRRHEVIEYVISKYSYENVANISTFGRFKPKMAIRDIGRVLAIPLSKIDKLAKMIPNKLNITIDEALNEVSALRNWMQSDYEVKEIIDAVRAFENIPRHVSTHAAGVVITKEPLKTQLPLYKSGNGISTQYNMTVLEELGFLKMDFLGLANLTIIDECLKLIREHEGVQIDIDHLPLDDKETYESISTGENYGVFQLESEGMREFMKKLKPEHIEDIIAGISLYRPGPMDSIPKYVKNRHNPNSIHYLHPILKPILEVTYGCIVYQEQVMEIVRQLAGYDYSRSDEIRRAMSKKKVDVMQKEREIFVHGGYDAQKKIDIPGCLKNGIDEISANKIFDDMSDFAKYAFNKAHAAGYALISYQTAYLKTHYPLYFYAALLNANIGYASKLERYIKVAMHAHIKFLKPDIRSANPYFSVEDNALRVGLLAVKNVGASFIDKIAHIKLNQPIENLTFEQFLKKMGGDLNKRAIESLILSGCMDFFEYNRKTMIQNYDEIVSKMQGVRNKNQLSLFEDEIEEVMIRFFEEYDKEAKKGAEKELLGFTVDFLNSEAQKLYIKIPAFDTQNRTFLSRLFHDYPGLTKAVIYDGKEEKAISYVKGVDANTKLIALLKSKYGEDAILLR